jgi:hypothetical protein
MEEEARKIDWDNIFKYVNSKRKLDGAATQLHDNINWVRNKVAPWITVKVDPDFIGNWATLDLLKETNQKNDANKKLVARGKNITKE